MRELFTNYETYFSQKDFIISFFNSALFLIVSLVVNIYASAYATVSASGPVTDIILSNTRVYDVDFYFVFGGLALIALIIFVCLTQPRRIPFAMKSIALFVLVRSVFITLTHIGPFPTEVTIDTNTVLYLQDILGKSMANAFFFGNDLFFSGHTGLPFLMAFIYWDNRWLRYLFILLSFAFAVIVLLGHLHYSIDVLAAFFITASIFDIAKRIFKKDYERGILQENLH